MVGYGPEDSHFVVELTYNYNISSYRLGNDFQGITIQSSECLERAKTAGWPVRTDQGRSVLEAPGGYKFFIIPSPRPSTRDLVLRRHIQQSIGANTRTFTHGHGCIFYHEILIMPRSLGGESLFCLGPGPK